MKRSATFAAVGTIFLLTANCSQKANVLSGEGSGGSGGAKTGAGGSTSNASGGASGSGGSSSAGGAGGSGVGSGGTTTSTTKRDAAAAGGVSGNGGGGGTTTNRDAAASGGVSGSGGVSAPGGGGGASTAKGGASGGAGTGGKTGAGGATGSGGAPSIDGGTIDGGATASTPSAGCGKATTLTSARASIDVAGKKREYILALPTKYDQNHPYKLIFGWHPWTGSAQMVASGGYFGLQKEANNEAIFVAGEGQDYQDAGLGWGNANGEDLDFLQAMLERFRSQLCIDESRIFSVGFSFGAMFSFTLGCESDTMMRAIMPMAGNTMTSGGCASGTRPVAVMAFIGTDDTLLSGHRQAVETYAKRNGCTTQTAPAQPTWCDGLDQKYLPCTCVSYQNCKSGYPVISCEYKAGHQQAPNPGPIWDFLSQF